jgi:hypothetical protein
MAMVTLTLQQAIELTREIMNAVSSGQWSDPTLRTWVGLAHWAEWADILGVNNAYYMQTITTSQNSSGQVAMSALSTGSGNTGKYWYRILDVADSAGQFHYRNARYRQYPNPQVNVGPYIWYPFGRNLQLSPIANGQSMAITVNYRPPRADALASLSDTIDFPDGYAEVIPWRAAKLALVKGGSETQAAIDTWGVGKELHDRMLQDLGRESTWPIVADSFDSPEDWGG